MKRSIVWFSRRTVAAGIAAAAASLLAADLAAAQTYPERPVRIIVPFAAGGGSDVVARAIAQQLGEILGGSFVVENRTGAAGSIGAATAARATPDGYTLLLGSTSEISQYPNVAPNIPYDSQRDFVPIAMIATVPLVLTVTDKLPVKTVQDVIDYANKHPGKLNFGSAGPGSTTHLAMALFNAMTKTQMTHVPYRGSAPVVADLIAGNLQLSIATMAAVLPHAKAGKVRAIAVSTAKRASAMPDVPTIQEGGVKGYATGLWTGLLAPTGTPADIVKRIEAGVAKAVAAPALAKILAAQGADLTPGNSQEFAAEIKRELAVWREVVDRTGIKIK